MLLVVTPGAVTDSPRVRAFYRNLVFAPEPCSIFSRVRYSPYRVCTRDAPPTMSSTLPKHLSAHTTYAARRRCDSLECSTIISVSSASGAAPSPPAERAATFLSAGSGALDNG